MITARLFVVLALIVVSLSAEAQLAAKVARIGYLALNLATSAHLQEVFLQGLRNLGYVEGRTVVIEYRDAEGKPERLPTLVDQGPTDSAPPVASC